MGNPKPLASVSRAITLVEYLAKQDASGVPLGTIASDLAVNKATAYNTLATLREHNWVDQDSETGFYRLGDGIAPIAQYRTSTQQLVDRLRPYLARIGRTLNELVHLGQLIDTDIIYLDKVEPDRAVRVVSSIGKEATAVTTALGRALIGSFENRDSQLGWYLDTPEINGRTKAEQKALHSAVVANFQHLDEHGWTEEIEENEPDIACVGVPLISDSGSNLAVSVSAPADRMTSEYRAELASAIRAELATLPADIPLRLRPLKA